MDAVILIYIKVNVCRFPGLEGTKKVCLMANAGSGVREVAGLQVSLEGIEKVYLMVNAGSGVGELRWLAYR